jgi:hypothetical protein
MFGSTSCIVRPRRAHSTTNKVARAVLEALEQRLQLSATLMGDAFSYPLGNFNNAGLTLNGGAAISNQSFAGQLQLSDGGAGESRSAFTSQPFNISSFATNFNVQFSGPSTSGVAFVIQGSSAFSLGSGNAGSDGIAKGIAIEFLATASGTETELNVNGVATTPTLISPSSIDLSNARVLLVNIEYDGSKLQVTETDNQTTLTPVTATQIYTNVNIPAATGGAAYLGFTGSDGSSEVSQVIQSWEFANNAPANTDIGSPAAAGSSAYAAGGQYTVSGAGTGAGSASDQFHYTSESITGDTTILAQLTTAPTGSAVEGLMLRGDTTANAAFAEVDMTSAGVQFISRSNAGAADVVGSTISSSGMQWLKLVRNGPTVSGYISSSSTGTWTLVGTAPVIGSTNVLMGLAVSSGSLSSLATAHFSSVSVTPDASIGLDTDAVAPFPTEPIWVDIIKQSTGFFQISNTSKSTTVNANGWPTTDFTMPGFFGPTSLDAGVYTLTMIDTQKPTVAFSGATLGTATYNTTTHLYSASVTVPGSGSVTMTVTNTGSGATNIQFIRPGYSATNPPVFTTTYISFLQSLGPTVLRFMNWTQTNNSPITTWASRAMPSDATQTEKATLLNFNGTTDANGQPKGVSWEYAIELANAVHADMWINIPAQANDNYVQQLASLIKNGDTINGVVYPPLSPDLNVYIEYSNETWNAGDEGFQYATDAAVAEVVAGAQAGGTPSNLNYDNLSLAQNPDGTYVNAGTWQLRWTARRLMQISNDFASVFGQSAIDTRIRPVLANIPIPSVTTAQLTYINAVFGAPSKFFYALAYAPYANLDGPGNSTNTLNGGNDNPNLSATDVLNDLSANGYALTSLYDSFHALAQQYGLQMDGYESGPDLSGFQDSSTSKVQAETDPRFSTFLEQYYGDWYANGGGTIIYYTANAKPWGDKFGDFQITDTQTDLFDAKEIGFRDAESAPRAAMVPAALTSLSATPVSSTQVNLLWSSVSATATEYRVEASTNNTFTANLMTQIAPGSDTSWSFTGLSPGTAYFFQVIATSAAGDGAPSPTASATTSGSASIPAVPFNVSVTAISSSQINLGWSDNSLTEGGFTITVATDSGFTQIVQTLTAAADATSLPIYDLNGGTTYFIRIAAFDSAGTSTSVVATSITTPASAPLAEYNFDESSGSTVLDSAANPANGTIVGGVTRIAGPNGGGALAFDGSTGYVNLNTPAKLNLTGQITIGAWIKPTAVTSQADIVSQDWDGLDIPLFLDLTSPTTVNFGTYRSLGDGNSSVQATGTAAAALTDGKWHYVAGVYDGQDFKVYIDGVLAGETADPFGITKGTEPTTIGRDSAFGGNSWDWFDGDIANVEIFANGLSTADVVKLGQATIPSTPVANPDSYKAIENTALTVSAAQGVLANDVSPNGAALSAVLLSPPASGTLALSSNGSFTFTPATNFIGQLTFTYDATGASKTSPATTVTLNVAPLDHLVFVEQPTNTTAGNTISPQIIVDVEDQNGHIVTTDNSSVSLVATGITGLLNGTLMVQAQNGVAHFTNLSLNTGGESSLTATDGSLTAAYSNAFNVAATDIWTGWISTDWNNPNNWSDVATPGGSTSATISGAAVASSPFNIAGLTIAGGTLQLAAGTGGFTVTSLGITGNGTLDLGNNQLIINYGSGSDPIASIRQYLTGGYDAGAWNGIGISSSAIVDPHFALGYADGADGVVAGLSSGQIEVKYTLYGDANLDGTVNGDDFTILAGTLGKSASAWDRADFNYDGVVNADDFTVLLSNLGKTANGAAVVLPSNDTTVLDASPAVTAPVITMGDDIPLKPFGTEKNLDLWKEKAAHAARPPIGSGN